MSPHWRVASLTIEQISQQMSQLDKMHSFFQQILCGQRSEGRTMLTEQFSLKCDHQRLFLWRQFLGLVTPEYICFSPISMENTNYRDLSTLNCDIHWISTDVSLGSLFLAKRPKEHLGFACRCTHNLTPLPKKERNEFEHVGWPHHTHRESAKLSPNGKFGRRAEAENNTEQSVMHNKNKNKQKLMAAKNACS